jgi:hypothetical protein
MPARFRYNGMARPRKQRKQPIDLARNKFQTLPLPLQFINMAPPLLYPVKQKHNRA